MGTGSFLGVRLPGRGVDHAPPSSAEFKERVELYLYSPFGPSWLVLGWTLPRVTLHFLVWIGLLLPTSALVVISVCCQSLSLSLSLSLLIRACFDINVLDAPPEYCTLFSWCSLSIIVLFVLLVYLHCIVFPCCDAPASDRVGVMLTEGHFTSAHGEPTTSRVTVPELNVERRLARTPLRMAVVLA